MKDFKVAPVATEEEIDQLIYEPPPDNEDSLARFRRVAKLAVLNSSLNKWRQVVTGACMAYANFFWFYLFCIFYFPFL